MKRLVQLVLLALLVPTVGLLAQPANDNCSGAIELPFSDSEEEATRVAGDTRGAIGETDTPDVCSGSWFRDDVWFFMESPADLPANGITVRCYFNQNENMENVPAVGMALYTECGEDASPLYCFSSSDPEINKIEAASICVEAGTTYYVRVWSGGDSTSTSGTFEIAAFPSDAGSTVLWEETWTDSLDGWSTLGTCAVEDSNANAVFRYYPDGVIDMGAYANAGVGVGAPSACDGAVGIDSDFDDNAGVAGNFGAGRCPAPQQYILVSPPIFSGAWDVAGLSISFRQGLRQFQSTFFVSFRTKDTGGDAWSDWRDFQFNEEYEVNSAHFNNETVRLFLGGATEGDSLQIRFVVNANYYYWGIDDLKLVETEAHNMRANTNWYAISHALEVPYTQYHPFYPQVDVENIGAIPQTNTNINFLVTDEEENTIYDEDLDIGTIGPDSLVENENTTFPIPVSVPLDEMHEYTGRYRVTSDSATAENDFDFTNNEIMFSFRTTENLYALEDGFTRTIAVNDAIYDDGAPLSYAFGNYMYFPNGSGYRANSVLWGINNPDDVAGLPINVIFYAWDDLNQNEIAEASERTILGTATEVFDVTGQTDVIVESILEPFDNADDLLLQDGGKYLAMIEYTAQTDTTFMFMLASEDYNYGSTVLASRQAGDPHYSAVLGFSPDGNIFNIDYEVTTRDDESQVYFGEDLIGLVRLTVADTSTSTNEVLSLDQSVRLFPNPAVEQVTVQMDFTEVFDEVNLQIIDATGKLIEVRQLEGVRNDNIQIDVSNYADGAYFLQVQTEAGSRSMRFVVQH